MVAETEVEALLAEREAYERSGKRDRLAQVDDRLARLGFAVEKSKQAPERTDRGAPENAAKPKSRPRRSAT